MCSVSGNLLLLNRILLRSSFTLGGGLQLSKRLIHVNERLLDSATDKQDKSQTVDEVRASENEHNLSGIIPVKYKVFRDEDAPIIFDVDEERERISLEEINAPYETPDVYEGINLEPFPVNDTRIRRDSLNWPGMAYTLKKYVTGIPLEVNANLTWNAPYRLEKFLQGGITGVYDIEHLVELLRKNNVMEMFVASVPKELVYVDHVVIVTGRSSKHMQATAEFVRKVYKKKRNSTDGIPKIEGKNSNEWIALDLGNIALHIFSQRARKIYDLDTLWSVGSKYDDQSNEPADALSQFMANHSYLDGLQPAEISN